MTGCNPRVTGWHGKQAGWSRNWELFCCAKHTRCFISLSFSCDTDLLCNELGTRDGDSPTKR